MHEKITWRKKSVGTYRFCSIPLEVLSATQKSCNGLGSAAKAWEEARARMANTSALVPIFVSWMPCVEWSREVWVGC